MDICSIIRSALTGATFVGLDTLTGVTLKGGKSNPMQGRITKRVTGSNVMVFDRGGDNGGYDAMVQRRLAAEGKDPATFTLSPRAWGIRDDRGPFVRHKGKTYLEVIFLSSGEVEYLLDGNPIAKSDIEGLQESTEGAQGGLTNKVIIRTYDADSVTAFRIGGKEYHRTESGEYSIVGI